MKNWKMWFLICCVLCASVSSILQAEENLPALIKQCQQSVVLITTYAETGESLSQGTGFFINKSGEVVTNNHVLEDARRVEIKTSKGETYTAKMITAEDKEGDIIRFSVDIPQGKVSPLSLTSSTPEVGEKIIVIGNPLGFEQTVSDGIISAVRDIPGLGKIIQMTAPISPGSSGSPVLNMKGAVIGLATLQSIEGQNLNFVVPSERIAKLTQKERAISVKQEKNEIAEWKQSEEGLCYFGMVFIIAEDYEKALAYFEKAHKNNADSVDAYFYIGYCNSSLGHYNEAMEAYKEVVSLRPDEVAAYNNLGSVYVKLDRYAEAIESFKKAISIMPNDFGVYYNLGIVYDKLNQSTGAIESYKKAISLKPDLAEAYLGLGAVYGNLGRDNEAIEAY